MTSNPGEIRTDRLLLRRVRPGDLRAAVAVMSDPETNLFNPYGPPTPEATGAVLEEWLADWEKDGIGYWAVVLSESEEVIGFGGLRHKVLDGEEAFNLFYRFRPEHWGRGYAPEMARAAIAWANRERPSRPVIIQTDVANEPSQRVAEKLGFAHAGEPVLIDGHPILLWRQGVPMTT
ncbi:GNAT family N-acetyltransferase [Actinosynnema sp. NPDC020468]|uniref:GNAT family N-acetyltransferase n=1 Tax=Actinosynnema sp. NPDC020468 TaxID=3154488 RepID=UPI0033E290D0